MNSTLSHVSLNSNNTEAFPAAGNGHPGNLASRFSAGRYHSGSSSQVGTTPFRDLLAT
jgi:hypothetical protein